MVRGGGEVMQGEYDGVDCEVADEDAQGDALAGNRTEHCPDDREVNERYQQELDGVACQTEEEKGGEIAVEVAGCEVFECGDGSA